MIIQLTCKKYYQWLERNLIRRPPVYAPNVITTRLPSLATGTNQWNHAHFSVLRTFLKQQFSFLKILDLDCKSLSYAGWFLLGVFANIEYSIVLRTLLSNKVYSTSIYVSLPKKRLNTKEENEHVMITEEGWIIPKTKLHHLIKETNPKYTSE